MSNIYNLTDYDVLEAKTIQKKYRIFKKEMSDIKADKGIVDEKIKLKLRTKDTDELEKLVIYLQNENTRIANQVYTEKNNEPSLSLEFNTNEELIKKSMVEISLRNKEEVSYSRKRKFKWFNI